MPVICSKCEVAIRWPQRGVYAAGCTLHLYHRKCVVLEYCTVCRKKERDLFLVQTSESGMKHRYMPHFDAKSLIAASDNPRTIKFLLKKINIHKTLVECVADDDLHLFEKIIDNTKLDMLSQYMGKTIAENIRIEPYRSLISSTRNDQSRNEHVRPPAPLPPVPRRAPVRPPPPPYEPIEPSAPPPSYEEAIGY